MAGLGQLSYCMSFHRDIGTRDLDQCRSNGRHDECKEERISFLSPGMDIGHERWFVQRWCKRIHVVEKERKDQQNSVSRDHVFQTMRPIVIRERWDDRGWRHRKCLLLPV